jgi:polysaccharide pyruvyl transferase WcaK-like protein
MNVLLLGYYGKHNIGDDLFVGQLTRYLAQQAAIDTVFVLCDESYYRPSSEKIQFVASNTLSPLQRMALILKSHCIAWGGGTLNISGKPSSLLRLQALARLTRKPFYFLGVGLEGLADKSNPGSVNLFQNSQRLYLRDQPSYLFAIEHLKQAQDCLMGGDLAFLDLELYRPYLKSQTSSSIQHLSLSGKFWWGDGRAEFYAQSLIPMIEKWDCKLHLLPGHVGADRNDNQFHQKLIKYLPENSYELHDWKYPEEFLGILSQMDFHIGNRLHSVIAADILGVPNIGIGELNSKIGHYLIKSRILSDLRLFEFMQPIPIAAIETIFQQYSRPEAFIQQESTTSQACMEKIFLAS